MPDHPLSAVRLYALLGDAMHDLPPHFIETLERRLEGCGKDDACPPPVPRLSLVPNGVRGPDRDDANGNADLSRPAVRSVPLLTLQGLDAVLEILHAAHIARGDGLEEDLLGERLVEGLIVSGRALVRQAVA